MAGINAAQLAAIPIYDGEPGIQVDLWVKAVDRCRLTFQWNDAVTANAAKSRLSGNAAYWLVAESLLNANYDAWDDVDFVAAVPAVGAVVAIPAVPAVIGLKSQITARFTITVNATAAVEAVASLRQKPAETSDAFYDRVVVAIDKKNFTANAAAKQAQGYQDTMRTDIFVHYAAGLKREIRERAFSIQNPPQTAAALRETARQIESTIKKIAADVDALTAGPAGATNLITEKEEEDDAKRKTNEIQKLAKEIAELKKMNIRGGGGGGARGGRGANRGTGASTATCHGCGNRGHFIRECRITAARRGRGGGQPQRGGGGPYLPPRGHGGGRGYRGAARPGAAPAYNAYAIDAQQQQPPPPPQPTPEDNAYKSGYQDAQAHVHPAENSWGVQE
jgi:hypothetical protein